MQNIKAIELKTDVPETISDFAQISNDFQCVVLMGINKDHAPIMFTSSISNYQKAFLSAFLASHTNNIFKNVPEG